MELHMNMKKLTLASAIMLALTGCGSSGGGSSNPTPNAEVNNNQATQTQVQQQKAEVEALKKQIAQAQANQKQAEDKLKAAEKTHNKDLTEAKKNLASAQANLKQAQSALKQAESQSSTNQKAKDALQKQLNQAEQNLSKAQQEKLLAEKELNNKLAEENKLMSREEVLNFALHNGLGTGDSKEFADDFQNKPKSYVIDQLLDTHKIIAIKRLARSYGLPEADVRVFAKENKSKTLEESAKILESKIEEIAQKREALSKEIFELAKAKGLEEWEAHNFAYGRQHSGKEDAVKELNQYVTEKAERETKINELINLAKEKGLEDWEASNFAYSNVDNERAKMLENLNQLAAEKEKQKAEQEKERLQREKEDKIRELAEQYRNSYFPNLHSFSSWEFTEKNKDKSLEEAQAELDGIKKHREEITELAIVLKEAGVSDYDIQQFIDNNTFVSLEAVKVSLENKLNETINLWKISEYGYLSTGGTPFNKPLGFLAQEDKITKDVPIVSNDREVGKEKVTTYSDIYNQKYSVVIGKFEQKETPYKRAVYEPNSTIFIRYDDDVNTTQKYSVESPKGFKTPVDKFPAEGKATYSGVAFDAKKQGELTYTVNFADKKGSGKITGLEHIGDLTLEEADIYKSVSNNDMRVKGNVIAEAWKDQGGVNAGYEANFFGPNAEEIAGQVSLDSQVVQTYSYDPKTNNYGYSSPDKYIKDVTISIGNSNDSYNSYNGGYTQPVGVDIGFGGTRGEISK